MPKTGATRYQKFLKSEKAKTKLKANKELPKGTNVTKTNFKIKKIIIREQLKAHDQNEALSKRKLNVKELLSRLNHFNANSRTDGLNGLKELITVHPEVLEHNLGQLIHGVAPMVLNIEKLVRRESLKVLHLILSNAKSQKVEPFFDVMCTYLRCAMTHIDNRIQEDSLLFLDVLLLCTPEKAAQDFHKIIPNFLDMISKLRVDSKPGRTLTVNLDSQLTSVRWRVKVLHRLQEYLTKFVNLKDCNKMDKNNAQKTYYYEDGKVNYYPLFDNSFIQNCHLSSFSTTNVQDAIVPTDEAELFKMYIGTLMPLLFDTWLEVSPKNTNSEMDIETVVSEEAATLLKYTLDVIYLIWKHVQYLNKKNPSSDLEKWFTGKWKIQYSQHIVSSFPYATNIRSSRGKRATVPIVFEEAVTDPKMVNENLHICHLFAVLNPNVNLKIHGQNVNHILNYVEKCLGRSQESINSVLNKLLHTLFCDKLAGWTKNQLTMNSLFKKIIWVFFDQNSLASFREDMFKLLCSISLNEGLVNFHETKAYETWIKHLPDILINETINTATIDILQKFAVQNSKIFNHIMKPKLLQIVRNLPKIKVVDGIDNKESSKKLFTLLYWLKGWDSEILNVLETQLMENAYGGENTKYIIDMLKIKSEGAFQ